MAGSDRTPSTAPRQLISGAVVADGTVAMHGKTDPQILTEILRAAAVGEHDIARLLPGAMAETERQLALAEHELRRRGEVIEGVVDALARLAAVAGVRQTLLTGNLVGNAVLKLAAFDLAEYFDPEIGVYGTDHADRRELVPIALERVARLRGEQYRTDEVWVIGDTPADLACARAAGVRCLLVATGQFAMSELARARCRCRPRRPHRHRPGRRHPDRSLGFDYNDASRLGCR